MNDKTYKMLRRIACDIREPALTMGRTALAVEGMTKAVGFLISEVHLQGDMSLAKRAEYAAASRVAADSLEPN